MIVDLFRRVNERRKLRRGQCVNCRTPLRDDNQGAYCSEWCGEEWRDKMAY